MRLGTWHRVHTYTVQLRLFDAGFTKMYGRRQPSTRMDIQHPKTCTAGTKSQAEKPEQKARAKRWDEKLPSWKKV